MRIQEVLEFDRSYLFSVPVQKVIPTKIGKTIYQLKNSDIIITQEKKALIVSELSARQAEFVICATLSKIAQEERSVGK
jgi:hypothetical protein